MGKILCALFLVCSLVSGHALKDEDTTNRPLYYQGKVKVQLTEAAMSSKDFQVAGWGMSFEKTGIASLDEIGMKHKASNVKIAHIEAKNKDLAKKLGLDRWIELIIPEDADVMAVVEEYKKDPNVSFAQPEYANYLMATPNDTYFANCWGHNNTKQLPAYVSGSHSGAGVGTVGFDANTQPGWDGTQGYGSSSIVIAIMDTGIDYDHPDLAAHYIGGWDAAMNDTNPDDNEGVSGVSGHGTSCAGVAAGITNNGIGVSGVAGNCSIMAIKVLNSSGSLVGMANGAIYAGDNGADILSMSYGGDYQYGTDATADAAYTYAYNAGVTLLAATGNDESLSRISYPANHPDIIGVGAAAPDNGRKTTTSVDGEYWWASQYCTVAQDDRAAVDFIAPTILPATDIVGSGGFDPGDYGLYFNGTSCATPYAAGFAALIKSRYPSYTPTQVRQVMVDTAMDIIDEESTAGWDGKTGYGLIDIGAALEYVPTAPPPAPTLTSPSNGSTTADATPFFDWEDHVDAATWTILVDNNSNFGSPEINQTVPESEYTAVSNLAEGTYYWKVLATNIIGSSPYSSTRTLYISFPDINLSTALLSTSAAPEASTGASFDIQNTGNYTLSYSDIDISYTGYLVPAGTYHSNDFQSGLVYTNSGAVSWATATGGTWNGNTTCAKTSATAGTNIITSASFNTTSSAGTVYLDFDHSYTMRSTSNIKVEYYTGSAWETVYTASSTSVTGHETIELPVKSANTQLRFTGVMIRSQAVTSSWSVDNIVVSSTAVPYSWLTINSSTSGSVTPAGSSTINIICDAAGLAEGTYNANVSVISDDPDEGIKVLPVEFTVTQSTVIPGVPSNVVTSISGTDLVIDWDLAADATSYDVYSSDDPYGTFSFEANVATNQYQVPASVAKKFYYIVSKNNTK